MTDTTTSTLTAEPPPPPPPVTRDRPSRLYQALAWVGIVAGVVFIVAVVFFSGFIIGKHSGSHGQWGHHMRGMHVFHRGGPMMGPPGGVWMSPGPPMAPGGQMGPGPQGPGVPPSPTTTPPPRP